MKYRITPIILALGALLMWFASSAHAATCGEFKNILIQLATKYQEIPVAGAVSNEPKVVLFVSPTATWSIFVVYPNGVACMNASGQNWETFKFETPGEKS